MLLPVRDDWRGLRQGLQGNLLAGVTVAIVALPLALAFGAASGLGAAAGLATAVVAGFVAALFGGSNLQVSGPTGAMTVVLVPVVAQFGVSGVLMVGLLAGAVLIAMALLRWGGFVRFLPVPVIEGFTAGIAVVIALQQVPAALGVPDAEGEKVWALAADAVDKYFANLQLAPLVMALAVASLMLAGSRWRPGFPFSLVGIAVATLIAEFFDLNLLGLGELPSGLPAPSLGFFDLGSVWQLLPSALAVATLAALESLLSASIADGMSVNERHDPDRELFGQGLANIAAPVFGGVPATAAIARTAVNVRAGATSRSAAMFHAVVLLLVVLLAAPLVSKIPLAALAGVLFATTIRMIEVSSLRALLSSTPSDAVIVVLTFSVTVVFDLITAVGVGLAVAVLLALRAVARSARLEQVALEAGDFSRAERELLDQHIVAYRLDGPLFFAAAHRLLLELPDLVDVRMVILRMSRVSTMDATGAQVLGDAIQRLEARGITVMLSGISPDHDAVLETLGIAESLRFRGLVFSDTPAAIAEAQRRLTKPRARPQS